jgi:hypothetical protein
MAQVLVDFKELHVGGAIYVVTDGGDNKSRISLPKLEGELISRGVRVFVFLVVRGGSRTEEEMIGASQMDAFAESTGGDVVQISSVEIAGNERAQLDKLAPRILGQVEGVYRLELGLSEVGRAWLLKKSIFFKTARKFGGGRKCLSNWRKSPIGHPDAILFLRISREEFLNRHAIYRQLRAVFSGVSRRSDVLWKYSAFLCA